MDRPAYQRSLLSSLESGEFSDLTVRCGDREWKLHKLVMCSGSVWFKTAFTNSFVEASTNEVTLQNVNSTHFGWLVLYLYSGSLNGIDDLEEEEQLPLHAAQLYMVADYFVVDDLKNAITAHLEEHFTNKGHEVQRLCYLNKERPNDDQEPLLSEEYVGGLRIAMEYVFDDRRQKVLSQLHQTYCTLVTASSWLLLTEDPFESMISQYPALVSLVFQSLMCGFGMKKAILLLPFQCKKCDKPIGTSPTSVMASRSIGVSKPRSGIADSMKTKGTCFSCKNR